MPTSYRLGQPYDAFVQAQLATGRYRDARDVLRTALRLMEEHEGSLSALEARIARVGERDRRLAALDTELVLTVADIEAGQGGIRPRGADRIAEPLLPHRRRAGGMTG